MQHLSQHETQAEIQRLGLNHVHDHPFALCDAERLTQCYDWHEHGMHQLLYALTGVLTLETAQARYVLPPQRAVWIPAGVAHRTWLDGVQSASVFLPVGSSGELGQSIVILEAPPLMREMILYGTRWSAQHPWPDRLAENFFQTFTELCREWMQDALPLFLPRSEHPRLAKAMAYAQADIAQATLAGACATAAMSERSFRRHFQLEVGMTWQQYLSQSRMVRAAALLAQPQARVAEVAEAVGFNSVSRFTQQFQSFFGHAPGQYSRRIKST